MQILLHLPAIYYPPQQADITGPILKYKRKILQMKKLWVNGKYINVREHKSRTARLSFGIQR